MAITVTTFLFRRVLPLLGIAASVAVLGQTLWLWDATGRRWFTQFHDRALIPAPPDDLEALLTQAGAYEQGRAPDIDNQFRLGLLPSGLDRFALSVMSTGGISILCIPTCLLLMRSGSDKDRVKQAETKQDGT